jgi:hypothetical protein
MVGRRHALMILRVLAASALSPTTSGSAAVDVHPRISGPSTVGDDVFAGANGATWVYR